MYAIIKCGGKQYKVSNGDIIKVDLLKDQKQKTINLPALLICDNDKIIENPKKNVACEIVNSCIKGKKITVYKYKAKKNVRKKIGHRQRFSLIKILAI